MRSKEEALSKLLSFVLRHDPASVGVELDPAGWVPIDQLIAQCSRAGHDISREKLDRVVETSNKKRFTISGDGTKIRAAQGHSFPVKLELAPTTPPPVLFHGTAVRFLDAIQAEGLKPQSRQHVHLSADTETALQVGKRHGKPVILRIDTQAMSDRGFCFYQADNGVWLSDHVPPEFVQVCSSSSTDSATTSRQPKPSI